MKSISFENEEIKERYQGLIKTQRGLSGIISLLRYDDKDMKIVDIIDNLDGITMFITKENDNITIDIDPLKKKAYLKRGDMPYKEIYDVYPRKFISPVGQLYQNNERTIINHLSYKLDKDENRTKLLELIEKGKKYIMTIKSNNELIGANEIINSLLDDYEEYNSIRDIFLAINRIFNINDIDLKLTDALGSSIVIEGGVVLKYVEIQEIDNDYQKIYLKDDNFFVEKKIIDKYDDNVTSYIKKLGEKNGKEK